MFRRLVIEPWTARATAGVPSQLLSSDAATHMRTCLGMGVRETIGTLEQQLRRLDARATMLVVWLLIERALAAILAGEPPVADEAIDLALEVLDAEQERDAGQELLRTHCEFVRGCIRQAESNRGEAQRALAQALSDYQRDGQQRLSQGVCHAGLALLALEAGDLAGERVGWPGAREQMDCAIVTLREGGDAALADYYRHVMLRIEAQWEAPRMTMTVRMRPKRRQVRPEVRWGQTACSQ